VCTCRRSTTGLMTVVLVADGSMWWSINCETSSSSLLSMVFCFTLGSAVAAPVFSKTLKSIDVPEGMALILECHVTGTPLPEISWFQDRNQLGDEAVDVVMGDMAGKSSARIGPLRPEHSGEYICRAANIAGESLTSASIRVVRE